MPSITARRLKELENAEKRLKYISDVHIVKPLVVKFGELLTVIAQFTPYDKWPKQFKDAFAEAVKELNAPTAGQIYLSRLPK